MSKKLAKIQPRYPMAQIPNALTTEEVVTAWREKGFAPQQISDTEALQTITITNDPLHAKLSWQASANLDGLGITLHATEATLLMQSVITAEGAQSICEYFTKGDGRIDLGTGEAMVLVAFKNGRLALDWNPKDAPIAAKKLLANALLYMIAKDAGLPLENLLTAFGWRENETS